MCLCVCGGGGCVGVSGEVREDRGYKSQEKNW